MDKAEEELNKRYGITRGDDTQDTSGIDMQRASDFIEGYHQAEKDLALTWEDMRLIHKISDDLPYMAEEDFYKEVLKRFNSKKQ